MTSATNASLRLRQATTADAPWLRALATHAEVARYVAYDAADRIVAALDDNASEVLVAEAPPGVAIGAVRVDVTNRRSRIAAIRSLMLEPAVRGRGLGLAVVRATVEWTLGERGMHRVEAEVLDYNAAGLRTFEAAGFRREGVRRRAYWRDEEWRDGIMFGLLAEERGR